MFIGTRIEQILSWNLFGTIKQKKKFTQIQKKFTQTLKKKNSHTHTKKIFCVKSVYENEVKE